MMFKDEVDKYETVRICVEVSFSEPQIQTLDELLQSL